MRLILAAHAHRNGFAMDASDCRTESADTVDWSRTDLGPYAQWPHELRLTVDILLNTPLPMLLVWGKSRILVFNDAYAALPAAARAHAPGGTVPAVWPP